MNNNYPKFFTLTQDELCLVSAGKNTAIGDFLNAMVDTLTQLFIDMQKESQKVIDIYD